MKYIKVNYLLSKLQTIEHCNLKEKNQIDANSHHFLKE